MFLHIFFDNAVLTLNQVRVRLFREHRYSIDYVNNQRDTPKSRYPRLFVLKDSQSKYDVYVSCLFAL